MPLRNYGSLLIRQGEPVKGAQARLSHVSAAEPLDPTLTSDTSLGYQRSRSRDAQYLAAQPWPPVVAI